MSANSKQRTSALAGAAPDGGYDAATYYQGEAARHYDRTRTMSSFARRKWMAEETAVDELIAAFAPEAVVLDMPCGTGRFDGQLTRHGSIILGADISLDMMREARIDTGASVPRLQADGTCLPLPSGAVPYALCGRFLNLIPLSVVAQVLTELRRVVGSAAIVEVRVKRDRPIDRAVRTGNRWRNNVARFLRRASGPTAAMPEREAIKIHAESDFIEVLGASGWRETARSEAVYTRIPVRPDPLLFILLEPM